MNLMLLTGRDRESQLGGLRGARGKIIEAFCKNIQKMYKII